MNNVIAVGALVLAGYGTYKSDARLVGAGVLMLMFALYQVQQNVDSNPLLKWIT
jgi:hypothetical protein